jgi:hypothetical protein
LTANKAEAPFGREQQNTGHRGHRAARRSIKASRSAGRTRDARPIFTILI